MGVVWNSYFKSQPKENYIDTKMKVDLGSNNIEDIQLRTRIVPRIIALEASTLEQVRTT